MNPLRWKRDHQIALGAAALLGIIAGVWLSWRSIVECAGETTAANGLVLANFLGYCWVPLLVRPLVGALMAAGVVYVRQLLRD